MKRLIGTLAAVAFLGTGAAWAGGDKVDEQSMHQKDTTGSIPSEQQDEGMGGSGMTGTEAAGGQQLTGTVVKAERSMIYIDHMGAIVPLKVDNKTQFSGEIKGARELKEGQQIRASYEVKGKTENLARSVELTPMQGGQGGSGSPIDDIPSSEPQDPSIDPTMDSDLSNPSTVPDTGEQQGPASPLPGTPPEGY